MSNIIHKVKDAVKGHGDHHSSSTDDHHHTSTTTGTATDTAGSTYDPVNTYDSNKSSNYGPHDSNIANTVDPRVDSDHSTQMTGATSTHGPHDSNLANKADPRVDSDLDGRATYNTASTTTGSSMAEPAHTTGANYSTPSSMMTEPTTTTGGGYNTIDAHNPSSAHTSGLGGVSEPQQASTHSYASGPASSTAGPHESNLANKADPRVDSDRSQGGLGYVPEHQQASTHSYASGPASSTAGPHESNLANKADPRVDSDRSKEQHGDLSGNTTFDRDVHRSSIGGAGVLPISGSKGPTTTKTFDQAQDNSAAGSSYSTTQKTVGPHKSDVANKMDPRVDSDLDGSATIGSQRT
ncbi:hypothetical protein N7462_009842 [Penicillium macrosclerotiorum]|uniref:uncharacterized protein n=1 Tax=Penicillium macrosclerotiorum TaxID=303699 RepID=UPI002547AD08|nr:uncharacterized protein N7462_009842 [Penicillium macrosclerotiorum]KAJ5668772.1 hypothetical protein N7462_009842 [Penicillium macrosclerotiorum]